MRSQLFVDYGAKVEPLGPPIRQQQQSQDKADPMWEPTERAGYYRRTNPDTGKTEIAHQDHMPIGARIRGVNQGPRGEEAAVLDLQSAVDHLVEVCEGLLKSHQPFKGRTASSDAARPELLGLKGQQLTAAFRLHWFYTPSESEVIEIAQKLGRKCGLSTLVALNSRFGAATSRDVPAKLRTAFIDECLALIKKHRATPALAAPALKPNPLIPAGAWPAPEGATHWDLQLRQWRKPFGYFCETDRTWVSSHIDLDALDGLPSIFQPLSVLTQT